tara:strand:- start:408 stop:581 length:174 start_codon:yes stop_codon:yes gene_type:complete
MPVYLDVDPAYAKALKKRKKKKFDTQGLKVKKKRKKHTKRKGAGPIYKISGKKMEIE